MSAASYSYGIAPFTDNNLPEYRKLSPNAATTVQRAFESAFLRTRWKLIVLSEVRQQPARVDISEGVIHHVAAHVEDDDAIQAAKAAGATAVILGQVDVYFRGNGFGYSNDYTTVGLSVRAVDVNTKQILWSATDSKSSRFRFNAPPEGVARTVANELVMSLVKPAPPQ
jgi:hypothetical protein